MGRQRADRQRPGARRSGGADGGAGRRPDDLVITVIATSKTTTDDRELLFAAQNGVQQIQFADGSSLDWSQIVAAANGKQPLPAVNYGPVDAEYGAAYAADGSFTNAGELQLYFDNGSRGSSRTVGGDFDNTGSIVISDRGFSGGCGGTTLSVAGTFTKAGNLSVGTSYYSNGLVAPVTITAGALTDRPDFRTQHAPGVAFHLRREAAAADRLQGKSWVLNP